MAYRLEQIKSPHGTSHKDIRVHDEVEGGVHEAGACQLNKLLANPALPLLGGL